MNPDFSRLSKNQCAAMHGVDPRTIKRWAEHGMPQNGDGTFAAAETIRWRMAKSDVFGEIDFQGIRDGSC